MDSPLLTLIFFMTHGFLCWACGRRLKKVYRRDNLALHQYLGNFFYGLTAFFVLMWLPGLLFGFNLAVIKFSFIVAQFFIFLALAYFILVPTGIWFPALKKLAFWLVFLAGVAAIILITIYWQGLPLVKAGFLDWNLPKFLAWPGFLINALVAAASALFFLRGGLLAQSTKVKKRSYTFALSSVLLLVSAYFWVANTLPGLAVSYLAGLFGYLAVYLGVYSID